MRTRVVLGRGGPRGPPTPPRYLSMKPPSLPYGIGSLLKGNRFEILASILENGPSENLDHSSPEASSPVLKNSVVDAPKIPDSNINPMPPKNLHAQNCSAPKLNNRLWAPLIKGGHKPPTVHCHSVY